MFLKKKIGASNPSAAGNHRGHRPGQFRRVSGGREREVGVGFDVVVGTTGLAATGADAERLVDDALDGAGATAAFGAAAEAAVKLLCIARKDICRGHGVADVVVAKDMAGTYDHLGQQTIRLRSNRYWSARGDAKGKAAF
jgi:hypothetical protein